MALYDIDAKKRLGYKCRDSRVRYDGTEILVGNDWKRRVAELMERCGGRCEQLTWFNGKQVRCKNRATDPHHIIKRSVRRMDNLSNLQALCRIHHRWIDGRKTRWTPKRQDI